MSENVFKQPSTTEIKSIPIIQHKPLTPLIEPKETQCQWSGCDLLFSTPVQLTEVLKLFFDISIFFSFVAYSICSYRSNRFSYLVLPMAILYSSSSSFQIPLFIISSFTNTYTRSSISMFTFRLCKNIYSG